MGAKVELGGVSAGKQFDPYLGIVLFIVIILGDSLTNLRNRDAHDRVRSSVVICGTVKDLNTQGPLPE